MQRGFSTIEMMIAMVVILVAVSAILMTSFGNQNFLVGGQTNAEALNHTKKILETAQAESRKDFRMVNSKSTFYDPSGYYKMQANVSSAFSPDDYFTKKVTGSTQWTDDSGITRSVELSTLVSNFENAIGGDTCNSHLSGNWTNPNVSNVLFSSLVANDISGTYQISDLDAYSKAIQKRLYVSTSNSSQTMGPNNPTSSVNDSSVGTLAWTSSTNVFSSNNAYVVRTMNGIASTHYLKITNFNLNVPEGATILGIAVEVERKRTGGSTGDIKDNEVKIVKGDGIFGVFNKATTSNWSTSDTYASYGNTTDLWGQSWSAEPAGNTTATNVNSTNFGIVFSAKGTTASTNRVANVDHVRITVTYIKQLYVLDTTTPTSPVRVGVLANNITNPSASAGFNALATDGRYVYAAVNAVAGGQIEIIDVSSSPYTVIKTFSLPNVLGTSGVGKSIFYKNGYVYLGLATPGVGNGPEFHIIDIHDPNTPVVIGFWPASGNLGNDINAVKVRGQYAYLSTPNNQELKVLDISDPSNPVLAGFFDAPDAVGNGKGLDLVGDTLYLGRTVTASNPELYLVDIKDQTSIPPLPLGAREISKSVNALLVRDFLAFVLSGTSTGTGQLQILNVFDPTSIIPHATAISLPNTNAGVLAETMDCEGNYLYIGSVPSSGTFFNKGSISIVTAS